MKKKSRFKAILISLSILSLLFGVIGVIKILYTHEHKLESTYVDSNTFTKMDSLWRNSHATEAEIYISDIYMEGGDASAYESVWVSFDVWGSDKVKVKKGIPQKIMLKEKPTLSDCIVSLYVMGNDPALDCQISGYWKLN